MPPIKRVAVIGAGPAGAITVDALAQEQAFDVIRVFERREDAGGCWLQDPTDHKQELPSLATLSSRTADSRLEIPTSLPATTSRSPQYRFSDTSIYPHLETNIHVSSMSYSQEPMPEIRSEWSISQYGPDSPFRHWKVVQSWISSLLTRNNYGSLISYNTTVELVDKALGSDTWMLTLRKPVENSDNDYWWSEEFDAVVIATGHYTVPYIPQFPGLEEFATAHPGVVTHSKSFRDPSAYTNKRVVVVGASISGGDISSALANIAVEPVYSVVRGKYHPLFGDWPFKNPRIVRKLGISHFTPDGTVVFADGTSVTKPDAVIFGTGYSWTLPFVPSITVQNNRVPNLYQHIFHIPDPTLCFVGATAAGFTFKMFEWQAVYAARFLAGRAVLPSREIMESWERERLALKGDGVLFTVISPDFEEYFNRIREMAGEPLVKKDGTVVGRRLPRFEPAWMDDWNDGVRRKVEWFQRINATGEASTKETDEGQTIENV